MSIFRRRSGRLCQEKSWGDVWLPGSQDIEWRMKAIWSWQGEDGWGGVDCEWRLLCSDTKGARMWMVWRRYDYEKVKMDDGKSARWWTSVWGWRMEVQRWGQKDNGTRWGCEILLVTRWVWEQWLSITDVSGPVCGDCVWSCKYEGRRMRVPNGAVRILLVTMLKITEDDQLYVLDLDRSMIWSWGTRVVDDKQDEC